jgi:oligopeptide transport system substrate-binding protein
VTRRLRLGLVLLIGAAALSLVSCSAGEDPAADPSVLHRGLSSDPESLDPHKARSVQAADILRDIGEGLLAYSASGELIPGVAESWQISEDGQTYTFTLRDAARWSNGDPVTAEDFVFGLRRLVDPATAAFYGQMLGEIVNAREILAGDKAPAELGVEAEDDRTLVIRLGKPVPYLLSLLTHPSAFPVHRGAIEEHGDAFARPGRLVSNGAYKLSGWEPGAVIKLGRNPYYWDDASTAIDAVHHHVLPQEMTELNRYRAGELHITSSVPPDSFELVRENLGDELHVAPYLGVYYYGFNLARPPFQDNPQIRRALSMAVDREVLVASITGRGEKAAYSWVPPGVDNYQPIQLNYASMTQDERNALARRLLREAGYGPDNPLSIELRYNTSDTQQRIALAIQSMWREVGVEAELINEEFQVLLANMRARVVTQVFRSSWVGDYNDAHTFLSVMESGSPSNMPGYANSEFDSLMQRAAAQVDPKTRRLHLEEAERVLLSDHPVIPLYFYVSKHLVSPRVRGWEDNVLDYHYSRHLSLAPNDTGP